MRLRWALVGAALIFAACAPPRVDFHEVRRAYQPKDYRTVQKRWTRSRGFYQGVYSIVFVAATLKSWDFRQAYIARYVDRFALNARERSALVARQQSEHREAVELFVSLAPSNRKWADLDKERSIWHLSLLNDRGDEVHPLLVERVKQTDLEIRMFFPYHTRFGEAYLIRFPRKTAEGKPLVDSGIGKLILRLAGAPGKAELVWQSATATPAAPKTAAKPRG